MDVRIAFVGHTRRGAVFFSLVFSACAPMETGRSFLVGAQEEAPGYALYSYLLFGSPPNAATRERYLSAVEAYLRLIPEIEGLERQFSRDQLNITYIPLEVEPVWPDSTAWILEHYNYPRARRVLSATGKSLRDGPYIISYTTPLSALDSIPGQYLYQDLSSVPAHIVDLWVREFLHRAANERFWDSRAREQFALRLRTYVARAAEGLPEVQAAVESWIRWVRGTTE